jgi:hypothetical protein
LIEKDIIKIVNDWEDEWKIPKTEIMQKDTQQPDKETQEPEKDQE